MDEWMRWALGVSGALVAAIGTLVWIEIKRIARNQHDTNNVVDRHDKWITVIREKLGMGPRDDT